MEITITNNYFSHAGIYVQWYKVVMCSIVRSNYKPDSSSTWTVCLMASPAGHESLSVVASASTITSFSGAKVMHLFAA